MDKNTEQHHDGIVCPICHGPISPIDYWAAVVYPVIPYAGRWDAAHVICMWALQAHVE